MWDLPGPGLEPVSPALAGGFLTTASPGKPLLEGFDQRRSTKRLRHGRCEQKQFRGNYPCLGWGVYFPLISDIEKVKGLVQEHKTLQSRDQVMTVPSCYFNTLLHR